MSWIGIIGKGPLVFAVLAIGSILTGSACGEHQAAPDAASAPDNEPPPFSVGAEPLQLGYILLDERFTTMIELNNEGDEPFTIQKIISGCVCSSVEAMNDVVPAHGSTTLVLDHDPYPYAHGWTKQIRIQTVERPDYWYTFVIQATCGRAVQLNRSTTQWVMKPSGNITASSIDGRPFRILSVHGKVPVLEGFDPAEDEPRSEYVIQYDLGEAARQGNFSVALVIETDHPDAPMVALRLYDKNMRRSYSADPRSWKPFENYVLVGPLPGDGAWVEKTFTLKRTMAPPGELPLLHVQMIATEPGLPVGMDVELVNIVLPEDAPRGDFDVTVRFRTREGAPSGFTEQILVITQDERFTQLPVYGRVMDATGGTQTN